MAICIQCNKTVDEVYNGSREDCKGLCNKCVESKNDKEGKLPFDKLVSIMLWAIK